MSIVHSLLSANLKIISLFLLVIRLSPLLFYKHLYPMFFVSAQPCMHVIIYCVLCLNEVLAMTVEMSQWTGMTFAE